MRGLCDVNLLLAFCYDRHEHHPAALQWLDGQAEASVAICRVTQLGLLRLLTNSSVMAENVCTLEQAWVVYEDILSDERFIFVSEPDGLEHVFREYTSMGQVSPKRWQDAYLAAFARASKINMVTFDRGSKTYENLRLTLLSGK